MRTRFRLLLFLFVLTAVACRHNVSPPVTARHLAEAEAACLSQESSWALEPLVRESIKTVFIAGRSKPTSRIVCFAWDSDHGPHWFLLDPVSQRSRIIKLDELYAGAMGSGKVTGLAASPEGKYLAVSGLSEALGVVDIVDLPILIQEAEYKVVRALDAFPGTVSVRTWSGNSLHVTSDMLLSYSKPGIHRLFLFGNETFSWDVLTGSITPLSAELRNPVDYFCARVSASDPATRREARDGLSLLADESANRCLENAAASEKEFS